MSGWMGRLALPVTAAALLFGCGRAGDVDDATTAGDATGSTGGSTTTAAADTAALESGGAETGSTSATTSDPTTSGSSETGSGVVPDNTGPCCDAHPGTGCSPASVAECVCASDRYCCESEWDDRCADEVDQLGCGVCPPDAADTTTDGSGSTGSTGTDTGVVPDNTESCCNPHQSTGCAFPNIAVCVCAVDPTCCEVEWHAGCVMLVGSQGCGVCPP